MLHVRMPASRPAERAYICQVMLGEFLGLPYRLTMEPRADTCITLAADVPERALHLADILLQTPDDRWLRPESLPVEPLPRWCVAETPLAELVAEPDLPVLFGRPLPEGTYWHVTPDTVQVGADLLGSAFFLLTRYEEVARPQADGHGRFPATASLAHREGFLARPMVNEYLELLWYTLHHLWPGLRRCDRQFRALLSHDVDNPLCTAGRPGVQVLKSAAGDLVKRRDLSLAGRRLRSGWLTSRAGPAPDLCNTFDRIMDLSEARGLRSAFNFIADHTAGALDGLYALADPWIRQLIRRIGQRGHEVGLHPSYHSYADPGQIRREFRLLQEAAGAEGIRQPAWGGRQHYLRWQAPITWEAWEQAALDYDSTLGFADRVGFRTGSCWEYPVFSLTGGRPLRLRERPLVVMEVTLLEYMGLDPDQAWGEIALLLARCRRYRGDFTLLWHNCRLIRRAEAELYRSVVAAL